MAKSVLPLIVCGAHMSGMPLNQQLLERRSKLLAATSTAPCYRLYALSGLPPRPGLLRVREGGKAIAVELWQMPAAEVGGFLTVIPPPLGLGSVLLADASIVTGFICEPWGLEDATDITRFGGWRAYMAALAGN